jgi:proline iminopeptidase
MIFYDHRCNGRSEGAPVTSMTWQNLTADADAIREALGFERWSVLGHSFGGHVALEYALRYPDRLSRLVLVNTAAEARWAQENAPEVLAARGFSSEMVDLCRSWFNGELESPDMFRTLMRLGPAYYHNPSLVTQARAVLGGGWRTKLRPQALIFFGRYAKGWSVLDRLGEIKVPTLVIAGASDFVFPPEAQHDLASRIPNARLHLVERAGHDPWLENPDDFFPVLRSFLSAEAPVLVRARGPDPLAGRTV